MNKTKGQGHRIKLFLIELLLSIFFFSVICAVCIQIFSKAYAISKDSTNLTQSVNVAANIAEFFHQWDGNTETFNTVFPEGSWIEQGKWFQHYDNDWQPITSCGPFYVQLEITESDVTIQARITVGKAKEKERTDVIYQLDLVRRPYQARP